MIRVHIKGSKTNAGRAAARHNLSLRNCKTDDRGGVYCDVPCGRSRQVVEWMTEKAAIRKGRGYPPGTLLYHTALCGALSGSRTRRRRRGRR